MTSSAATMAPHPPLMPVDERRIDGGEADDEGAVAGVLDLWPPAPLAPIVVGVGSCYGSYRARIADRQEGSVPLGSIFPNDLLYEFVTLFVVLDPIATLPVFTAVSAGLNRRQSLLVAFYALGVSFLVLLFFIVAGQHLLEALKIPMASFQLAGSLVLLLFGLKMVLGKITEEAAAAGTTSSSLLERAIYPLAVPGIAGAGAMLTVVLLTDNKTRSIAEQVTTTGILVLCLAILFGMFAAASLIFRVLGRPGVEIVSRVFGLILASIAVTSLVIAIKSSFGLPIG